MSYRLPFAARRTSRGIALAPVLFVVAVLGVLASALAASSGAFFGKSAQEQDRAKAAAMIEYGLSVKQTVERLLWRGCDETALDFTNGVWLKQNGSVYQPTNPNATSDCKVFLENGAAEGVIAQIFEGQTSYPTAAGNLKPGHARLVLANVTGIGTTAPDLLLDIAYPGGTVCKRINKLVLDREDYWISLNHSWANYAGSFSGSFSTQLYATNIDKKIQFCYAFPSATFNDLHFMTVLIAR